MIVASAALVSLSEETPARVMARLWLTLTVYINLKRDSRLTRLHLAPGETSWMYVGTDRGNVYLIKADTLVRSSYSIMWNHATTE